MKTFRGTVQADKWPQEFTVQATSWPTALSRIGRAWMRKNKGSKAQSMTVKIFKGADLKAQEENS